MEILHEPCRDRTGDPLLKRQLVAPPWSMSGHLKAWIIRHLAARGEGMGCASIAPRGDKVVTTHALLAC